MALTGLYLGMRIRSSLLPTVRGYRSSFSDYILPAFNNLEGRADEVQESEYEKLCADPPRNLEDPAEAAEVAHDRAVVFYETMTGMRQTTLNLFASGLFHLMEQQLAELGEDATFAAMGVESPEVKLDKVADWYADRLRLDLNSFPMWAIVDELRLVANAVKHGEGSAARQLRDLRPTLFEDPRLKEVWSGAVVRKPLRTPLAGENLYVTEDLFAEYARAAEGLLEAVAEHFDAHGDDEYPK